MKLILRTVFYTLSFALLAGCSVPASNQSSSNRNTNSPVSNSSSTNANSNTKANQGSMGTIEVSSTPPGAKVLLISDDESGAGEPQSKGLTPATITGVEPGKYTVHLERPGYKFFQKSVTVKAGSTVKISGNLKKQ